MTEKAAYADCSFCGGHVSPKLVEKACSRKGRLVAIVRQVPAGVCDQCGERYFKASVAKHLESMLPDIKRAPQTIQIPVANYAA